MDSANIVNQFVGCCAGATVRQCGAAGVQCCANDNGRLSAHTITHFIPHFHTIQSGAIAIVLDYHGTTPDSFWYYTVQSDCDSSVMVQYGFITFLWTYGNFVVLCISLCYLIY